MSRSPVSALPARTLIAFVLASFAVLGSSQLARSAEDEEAEELREVQVTGTRIISPNTTATNPITSITSEEVARLGIVNVVDALTMLVPQNISTYQPSLVGDDQAGRGGGGMEGVDRGTYFIGNTIAKLRGMDPAFGSRTLTLVNGRARGIHVQPGGRGRPQHDALQPEPGAQQPPAGHQPRHGLWRQRGWRRGQPFPAGWGPYPNPTPTTGPNAFSSNSILSATAGISATPGLLTNVNGSNHSSLSNVTFATASTSLGNVRTISGEFGPGVNAFQFGVTEIADFASPAMGINLGFIGGVPGGNPIATSDPRPPSPNYYKIGLAASFQFDGSLFTQPAEPFTTWCSTEILGIRPTLNGQPVDFPFYFCRTIASP
jgi:hypothetical protein